MENMEILVVCWFGIQGNIVPSIDLRDCSSEIALAGRYAAFRAGNGIFQAILKKNPSCLLQPQGPRSPRPRS